MKNCSGNNHPSYLIVHTGGYDIGRIKARALRKLIMKTVSNLMTLFSNTCIVWSYILPRLQWRYSKKIEAMENIRARNNRAIIKHMVQIGGKTIKHEDFNDKLTSLCEDYCHLSLLEMILF